MSSPENMGRRPDDAHSPPPPITPEPRTGKQFFNFGMLQKLHHFFGKDDQLSSPIQCPESGEPLQRVVSSRSVGVGLPRQATFRRQNSERRERLCPVEPCSAERRAISHSRTTSMSLPRPRSNSTPPSSTPARVSAPVVAPTTQVDDPIQPFPPVFIDHPPPELDAGFDQDHVERPPRPPSTTSSNESHDERYSSADEKVQINAELDSRWILNLSMHFRDKSDREKFFVTFAETPTKWRRVTVSCDYRNAEPGSLEMDLKELQFQRDKSLQIYESIRDSLSEIQFYDTVTNLKLETRDGRLHVHVTEDTNEIIPYPPRTTVAQVLDDEEYRPKEVLESQLTFESHLSGFVYKVLHEGKTYIKKEIPGPDTVDEFLYEINALHALYESDRVIQLEGIVLDDSRQVVKGLLIDYAERGAIVDLLYDHHGDIPWTDRLSWARDAVRGLSEIHEEGYVQGDFTLSNIVVDSNGGAKIIDINRRGCPVGWEPPEIARKIASHQRISMYIGEKTDLYQLGMTLWGLAADDDEPERHDPPLSTHDLPEEIPGWYKRIVEICLSDRPRDRLSATQLCQMFPSHHADLSANIPEARSSRRLHMAKKYIDPAFAVERDDIERLNYAFEREQISCSPQSSRDDYTFTYPRSSNYERESDSSAFERPRGRRPPTNLEHLNNRERRAYSQEANHDPFFDDDDAQIISISPDTEPEYAEIELDGRPYLIARNTFSDKELQILEYQSEQSRVKDKSTPISRTGDGETQGTPQNPSTSIPQRPRLSPKTSCTSSSTPRNSHTLLPSLTDGILGSSELDSRRAELPGFGGHLNLSSIGVQIPSNVPQLHERRNSTSPQPPPRLPYADSGYDEPLSFADAATEAQRDDSTVISPTEPLLSSSGSGNVVVRAGETGEEVQNVGDAEISTIAPPPLVRADTSIKLEHPETERETEQESKVDHSGLTAVMPENLAFVENRKPKMNQGDTFNPP